MTTSVGQWVMHDLRRIVYSHIQHLSLGYHTQKRTGDFISRITSDVDAIQSFIVSELLGLVVDVMTLLGMAGVMFYLNWRFTLIALVCGPAAFRRDLLQYPPQQEGVARCAEKRGRNRLVDAGSACPLSASSRRLRGKTMKQSVWKRKA